jgi:hypothetical protein
MVPVMMVMPMMPVMVVVMMIVGADLDQNLRLGRER